MLNEARQLRLTTYDKRYAIGDMREATGKRSRMASPTVVTDETFNDQVLKSGVPTLVDFWAIWCGPCKMVSPLVDEIARENEGKLKVMKLDVDENEQTAMAYGVMSIPTLILFKNGTVAAQKVGALSKSQLTAFLDSHL